MSKKTNTPTNDSKTIAILGSGNIGGAIAHGFHKSGITAPENIVVTRRRKSGLDEFTKLGIRTSTDNKAAVKSADIVIVAVTPKQMDGVLQEISSFLNPKKHIILSIVSGASIEQIKKQIKKDVPVVRVMPNTAIAIQESMTCISGAPGEEKAVDTAVELFGLLGQTMVIEEKLMVPATALVACGIAYFLRAVRAASQGGVEIGFHAEDALFMAAQTAKGAASLLLTHGAHPEREVDKVTTPMGSTITGLNTLEHNGFSSAFIKGIVASAEKAGTLYSK